MSASRPIVPYPQDRRWQLNHELENERMAALDSDERFIVRRLVSEAYAQGFEAGWLAGQHDADSDQRIARAVDDQNGGES